MAAVKQLGIFSWFVTFSAADLKWTDTIQAIAKQTGVNLSDQDVQALTWDEKCRWLRSNPVTAARHFDHRLQCIFRDVILSPTAPLGKVFNYFYRIEFQQRGSPHAHCVLWIENEPNPNSSHKEICNFVEKHVTCSLPSDNEKLFNLASTVQRHSH